MNRYEELEMELKSIDKRKKEISEEMTSLFKRPELNETYYFISHSMDVVLTVNTGSDRDNEMFESFNYFKTEEEAQVMADKFKAMLKEYKTNPKKDLYIRCDSWAEKAYYGKLGDKTNIVYSDGSEAHVGDVVYVTSKSGVTSLYDCGHGSWIFKTNSHEDGAVMGFAIDIKQFNAHYTITKVIDWSELEEGYQYEDFRDTFVVSEPPMPHSLGESSNE